MKKKAIGLAKRVLPTSLVNKIEFERQKFNELNERPVEFAFVFNSLIKVHPSNVLDVGTGTTALPHLMRNCGPKVTAIDNIRDYWPAGMTNKHFHVLDVDITSPKSQDLNEKYDLITCISVLEHIKNHNDAMKNMFALLADDGFLVLTCPYTENQYVEDTYKLPESNAIGKDVPFVCQSYSRAELDNWLKANNGEIVTQEFWQVFEGACWSLGERIPPIKVEKGQNHQLTCLLIKKRNG